jgi:hypothetical protein
MRTPVGHPPTTTHRYAPGSGSIVLHVCMSKGMVFVFHQIHPNDCCRPPPLRTTVGHPPATTHRYTPGSGSNVLQVCMCKGIIWSAADEAGLEAGGGGCGCSDCVSPQLIFGRLWCVVESGRTVRPWMPFGDASHGAVYMALRWFPCIRGAVGWVSQQVAPSSRWIFFME